MADYVSAGALLADARLRLDASPKLACLIVEGPDDKRLFGRRASDRRLILAGGGRGCVLAAHRLAGDEGEQRVAFVTDCDYEVVLGRIKPETQLFITAGTTIENDLIAAGALLDAITELVPRASESDEAGKQIYDDVLSKAAALAEPQGRLRLLGQREGVPIDTKIRNSARLRTPDGGVDVQRLVHTVVQNSPDCPYTAAECVDKMGEPQGLSVCNGKDLIQAAAAVLHEDYSVPSENARALDRLVRHGLTEAQFDSLAVVRRLRKWSEERGLRLFDRE